MTSTRSRRTDSLVDPLTKSFLEESDDSDDDLGHLTFSQNDNAVTKSRSNQPDDEAQSSIVAATTQPQSPSLAESTRQRSSLTVPSPDRRGRSEEEQAAHLSKHVNCQMKHIQSTRLLGWRKNKHVYYPVEICPNQEQGQFLVKFTETKNTLIRYLGCFASHAGEYEAVARSVVLPVHEDVSNDNHDDTDATSAIHTHDNTATWCPSYMEAYKKFLSKRSEFQPEPAKVRAEEMVLDRMLQSVWENEHRKASPSKASTEEAPVKSTEQSPSPLDEPNNSQTQEPSSPTDASSTTSSSSSNQRSKLAPKRSTARTTSNPSSKSTTVAKKLKLRAGDVIQYHSLEAVASRENILTATITAVYPAPHPVALSLDNGQVIPRDACCQILLLKRFLLGSLKTMEHRQWIDLEDYGFDKSYNDKVFDHANKRTIGHVFAEMRQETQKAANQFWEDTNADYEKEPPKDDTAKSTTSLPPKVWPTRMPSEDDLNELLEQTKAKRRVDKETLAIQQDHLKTCQAVWDVLRHLFQEQQAFCDMNKFLEDLIRRELKDTDLDHEWSFLDGNKHNLLKIQKVDAATQQWKRWLEQHSELTSTQSNEQSTAEKPAPGAKTSNRQNKVKDSTGKTVEQKTPSSSAPSASHTKPVVTEERDPSSPTKHTSKSATSLPKQSARTQPTASKKRRLTSNEKDLSKSSSAVGSSVAPSKTRRISDPGPRRTESKSKSKGDDFDDGDRIPRKQDLENRLKEIQNAMDTQTKKRRRSADPQVEEAYLQTLLLALPFTLALARESGVSRIDAIVRALEPSFDHDITVENLWQFLDGNKNGLLRTERLKEITEEWERVMKVVDQKAIVEATKGK